MARPRVLVLDEELPLPANTGKRIRTVNLLRRLSRDFDIELLVHESEDAAPLDEARALGIGVTAAPARIQKKSGLGFYGRLAANAVSSEPYSVTSHRTAAFDRAVRERIEAHRPVLVHAEWTPYAQYWREGDPTLVIAAHNVESEVLGRIAETSAGLAHRAFFKHQALCMERFERSMFARAPHATAVTERDAQVLRSWGCPDVEVVPNGVDTAYFVPWPETAGAQGGDGRTLVFTGSMDWRPNQDAIAWFAHAVHPLLAQAGPYRLTVVGRNPPGNLSENLSLPAEIVLTGTVDDVRPYLGEAAVFVTPLRVGGGSRLKILEALAMGKAVVTTSLGAEGLDLTDGRDLLRADDPRAFAETIEALWRDPARAHALGLAGRDAVLAAYDWDALYSRQARLWDRALRRGRV
ncbi:MAG: glycosyltransferase [Acidobacteria bacterium]|jgi:glycosyltransferase involved in cell wall biosynthesis|nr:glycosyltransferase [Acidobacteriota bacterium]